MTTTTARTLPTSMPLIVGLGVMARIVGMSKQSFRERVRAGDFPQPVDGVYDVPKFVKVWHEWKAHVGDNPRHEIDKERAAALKRANARADGNVMETQAVLFLMQAIAANISEAFDSMPGRIAATSAMQEAAVIEQAVRVECEWCRSQIRKTIDSDLGELSKVN